MKKYAQIDDNNICIATANIRDEVIAPESWIPITDDSIIGKRYNNGFWEDVPQPEPEPTQLDKIEEQVYNNNDSSLIIMEAMADQYEQTEEYRLNDMEVQATIFESVLALSEGGTTV